MYTTDCNYFNITNYNNVQEGYYRWTGCTGIVSISPINTLDSHYVCARDIMVEEYGAPLTVVFAGLCPSNTPTPTITPTITPTPVTQTPTPTPTITPTITQTFIPSYNLWSAGYFENACNLVNIPQPSNVTIYSTKSFTSLVEGDFVYGNAAQTIPPNSSGNIISDGAVWIQISILNGQVLDVGICN
jgi:hypothetical protein